MDPNMAAWMIAGGPRQENPHAQRDREQLLAFRESQQAAPHEPGLVARLTRLIRLDSPRPDPVCDPA
jgi:hypothetical protein